MLAIKELRTELLLGFLLSNGRQSRFQAGLVGAVFVGAPVKAACDGEAHIICEVAYDSAAHLSKHRGLLVRPTKYLGLALLLFSFLPVLSSIKLA